MNLDSARVGLLLPEVTPIWTGTVSSFDADAFEVTVATVTGSLSAEMVGMPLVHNDADIVRIRSVNAGTGVIAVAETGCEFDATNLAIYRIRVPFPRLMRLLDDGTMYQDWDIAFPANPLHALPPDVIVYRESKYLRVGEQHEFFGQLSRVMAASGSGVTLSWSAPTGTIVSTGGTVGSVVNASATARWDTAGWHYLHVTGTDGNGATFTRYVVVAVGLEPETRVSGLRLEWSLNRGWKLSCQFLEPVTHFRGSPVLVVDLDTYEVLLYGFLDTQGTQRTFEVTTQSIEALGALAYAETLISFPFPIYDDAAPADWTEVEDLTWPRALWFLLVWHSNVANLLSIDLGDPAVRELKGFEFTGNSVFAQAAELFSASRYVLRGYRSGGFVLGYDWLYQDAASFGAATAADLAVVSVEEDHVIDEAQPRVAEVRMGGVYRDVSGDWEPVIIKAPSHPLDLGSSVEVNNLAPISAAEIGRWASRYIGIEDFADRHTVRPTIDVNPAVTQLADLSTGERIAIEVMTLSFVEGALAWRAQLQGRTWGRAVSTYTLPAPPELVYPVPPIPPIDPPIPPITEPVWGGGDYLALGYVDPSNDLQVWVTSEGQEASPTWHDATGNVNSLLTGTPNFDGIVFQNGGTYPLSLYLATHEDGARNEVWYCQDPFAASPTWSRLSTLLPAGVVFSSSLAGADFRPKPQPNPSGNGEMLLHAEYSTAANQRYACIFQDGALVYATFSSCSGLRRMAWIDEDTILGYGRSGITGVLLAIPKTAGLSHLTTSDAVLVSTYTRCPGPFSGSWWPATLPEKATALPLYGYVLPLSTKLYMAEESTVCSASYFALDETGADLHPRGSGVGWDTVLYAFTYNHPDAVPGEMALWLSPIASTYYIYYSDDAFATPSTQIQMPDLADGPVPLPGLAMVPGKIYLYYRNPIEVEMRIAEYDLASGAWTDKTGDFVETNYNRTYGKTIAVFWGLESS